MARDVPPGTFVPPHIHPDQDEYLYILEGRLDFMLDGADEFATPGDLVRLPMGKPHGIFNKSQQNAKTLFWVSPTRRLYELFWAIHNMKQQNPNDGESYYAGGGGRKWMLCSAASRTTSLGFCCFMLWMAQNSS